MLAQRRRRWANIEPPLGQCVVLIGSIGRINSLRTHAKEKHSNSLLFDNLD